jgi:threonine synthase
MPTKATKYVCSGCGTAATGDPFRCPRASDGSDIDHVLTRVTDLAHVSWPPPIEDLTAVNPFIHFAPLLHAYQVAVSHGVDEAGWRTLVEQLDGEVAAVEGHGFRVTPLSSSPALAERLGVTGGGVWVKDETGNVSGSHKARHLMGILLYLSAQSGHRPSSRKGNGASGEGQGFTPGSRGGVRALAIASCGNAARRWRRRWWRARRGGGSRCSSRPTPTRR